MQKVRKFNPERFRALMGQKIQEKGYNGVKGFAEVKGFHRNPLARAMTGVSRPSVDSLNSWCRALECTPEERAEIIASVYVDEEDIRFPLAS